MDFDEKKIGGEAKIICSHGKMFLPLLPDWRGREHHCSMIQGSPVAKQSSEATTTLILSPKQITSSSETLDPWSPRASWWLQAQGIGQIPSFTWWKPFCNILYHRVVALSLTVSLFALHSFFKDCKFTFIHICKVLLGASLTITGLKFLFGIKKQFAPAPFDSPAGVRLTDDGASQPLRAHCVQRTLRNFFVHIWDFAILCARRV